MGRGRAVQGELACGDAWARFYLEHRRALGIYATALTGNVAEGADLIQDVLLRMLRERRAPTDPRAFVYRSMRNLSVDRRRNRAARTKAEAEVAVGFLDAAAADSAVREEVHRVREALARLGDAQREVVILRVYVELGFEEIAEVLNRPLGTVASQYRRSLEALRAELGSEVCDGTG